MLTGPGLAVAIGWGQTSHAFTALATGTDDHLARPRRAPTSGQLPRDIPDFVGRQRELRALSSALGSPRGVLRAAGMRTALIARRYRSELESQALPVVVAISGIAGVGKSALAVRAAHRVGDNFPDAHLYANLRVADGSPLDVRAVLVTFLRALGLDDHGGTIPEEADGQRQLYRALLSRQRALIVLDNAQNADQVRPLLSVGPACAVIVTSREPLSVFDGAHSLALNVLPEPRALELLGHLIGVARVRQEVAAARDIAALCGLLPLALRLIGGSLANRDSWSLAHDAERLADEHARLSQLQDKHVAVDACLSLAYAELQATVPAAARLFRLLSMLEGQDFGVAAAAALLDRPEHEAESALLRLVEAQLVEPAPGTGQYQLHPTLRRFARARLADEESHFGVRRSQA